MDLSVRIRALLPTAPGCMGSPSRSWKGRPAPDGAQYPDRVPEMNDPVPNTPVPNAPRPSAAAAGTPVPSVPEPGAAGAPAAAGTEPWTLRVARLAELDAPTFYRIAALREAVFCIEQGATDADLDGRELEDGTRLVWFEDAAGEVVAQARVLVDDGAMRIGRLVVRADHRRDGLGRRTMLAALDVCAELAPELDVHIDAQAHLEDWYASMGYRTVGGEFLEAGIPHVPMVRPAGV